MDTPGKLVRDRIPELIQAAGGTPIVRRLQAPERLPALLAKLEEESHELREAVTAEHQLEELGDVLEVLRAIVSQLELTWPEVEAAAQHKRTERGAFDLGVWLERHDHDAQQATGPTRPST